jgi:hypothetical protein
MVISATIILTLKLGHHTAEPMSHHEGQTEKLVAEEPDAMIEPV